jgi:hypothetical protein
VAEPPHSKTALAELDSRARSGNRREIPHCADSVRDDGFVSGRDDPKSKSIGDEVEVSAGRKRWQSHRTPKRLWRNWTAGQEVEIEERFLTARTPFGMTSWIVIAQRTIDPTTTRTSLGIESGDGGYFGCG